ncbi:claudin-10-like [Dreissena polymorpha]|uniref:Uncharacterized protein n=1 Tax=Dreissena polymorpha TaxID=45954 RepID=A0A9D4L8D6_DREPO|nr:claudin-10-like [Dreissena polymorpha]KAH3853910.1 hypothetical protein DPMN_096448 [Dreissena polymorpha]
MGAVEGFKGASLLAKVSLVLLLIAALFSWISFTTTGWAKIAVAVPGTPAVYTYTYYGLWRSCQGNNLLIATCGQLDGTANDWWAATQALVTFGFLGINFALFFLVLKMFVGACAKNGEIAMATAIICIATGVLYLIGVIVFGAEFNEHFIEPYGSIHKFGFGFALSIIAMVLEIVAGVLLIVDNKKGGTSPSA